MNYMTKRKVLAWFNAVPVEQFNEAREYGWKLHDQLVNERVRSYEMSTQLAKIREALNETCD